MKLASLDVTSSEPPSHFRQLWPTRESDISSVTLRPDHVRKYNLVLTDEIHCPYSIINPCARKDCSLNGAIMLRLDVAPIFKIRFTLFRPNVDGIATHFPSLGDSVTFVPAVLGYITKIKAPAIWSPKPTPAHPASLGAVI